MSSHSASAHSASALEQVECELEHLLASQKLHQKILENAALPKDFEISPAVRKSVLGMIEDICIELYWPKIKELETSRESLQEIISAEESAEMVQDFQRSRGLK